jgi:hypothetical protein
VSALLAFLRGEGPDGRGRRIAAIWAMSDAELEASHDFIQWLFPLDTPSAAVPGSPVLGAEEIAVLHGDRMIRANLRRSLDRMLGVYGLAWDSERRAIHLAPHFGGQAIVWLSRGNHNLRRLTRILRSLVLAGERDAAAALFARLEALYRGPYRATIGAETFAHWAAALGSSALGSAPPSGPSQRR